MGKYKDLTGERFGRLTVKGREPSDKGVRWRSVCDCGNEVVTNTNVLVSGYKKSCGCLLEEWRSSKHTDIIGQRFGRLVVVEPSETVDSRLMFKCKCDCGNEVVTRKDSLLSGHTTSCGCRWGEVSSDGSHTRTHGKSTHRLYWIWHGMKDRCYNQNSRRYHKYGGEGVVVCDEWRNDFQSFYDWSMLTGYDEASKYGTCTLDRINPTGNYEPSNCRWITTQKQQNNKRYHRYAEHNGEKKTVAEWAKDIGITYAVAYHHIVNLKESIEEIISKYGK